MGHNHHHHHGHSHEVTGKNLSISIILNIGITAAQIIGGFISGSLSLLSDALHNFSDVISLILSFVAHKLAKRKPSFSSTFGYKRAELLAAFINAATLIIVAFFFDLRSSCPIFRTGCYWFESGDLAVCPRYCF